MNIKIAILAAGKGTRMKSELPKVLVPVNDKPMIIHLLEAVFESGVDQKPIIVVSPDNEPLLKKALAEYNLEFVIQERQLGTGHAVNCVISRLDSICTKLLVVNGDHPFIKSETIKKLAAAENKINLLSTRVENYSDWQKIFYHWGRIIKENETIKAIIEFKDANDKIRGIKEVNPAMYAFNLNWLKANISKINTKNAQEEFYLTDLIKLAFEQHIDIKLISVEPREVIGINSIEELKIAEKLLK